MHTILHFSDPHFGRERAEVVAALLQLHERLQPELVIVSGDLTQRAWPYQFERAGRFLQRLGAKAQLLIPGNHDLPLFNLYARLTQPYGLYCRTFGESREPVYQTDRLLVMGVDTSTPRRRLDGEITAAQIDRVCQRLRSASPTQLRLVVVHQPVAVPDESDRQTLLHGAEHAVSAWVDAGVDAVLGGHIHLPFVRPLQQTYPQLRRMTWVIHAGTAVSDRLRMGAPNSVNELRYLPEIAQLQVIRWDYSECQSAFEAVGTEELALDRGSR